MTLEQVIEIVSPRWALERSLARKALAAAQGKPAATPRRSDEEGWKPLANTSELMSTYSRPRGALGASGAGLRTLPRNNNEGNWNGYERKTTGR